MKKVIILGGGIAGLSTAIALQRLGMNVQVFEKALKLEPVGAGIILAPNVIRIFEEWGITQKLKKHGQFINRFVISSDKGKTLSKLNESLFPEQTIAIHRADLHHILLEELKSVPVYFGKKAVECRQHRHGVTVLMNDGEEVKGDMLIAADGIHSVIRKQLLPNISLRYAGYTCWRGVTQIDNHMNLNAELHELWGPNGRFGYLPISKTKAYWYMLINTRPNDHLISNYFLSDLIKRLENYPQHVTDFVKLIENNHVLKHDIYDIPTIDQYVFDNIALIGDAAHAMTPNLGQGACQGIEDAYILGMSLFNHPDSGLQAYQKERVDRANKISKISRRVGIMAQFEHPFLCRIRNLMMKTTPQAFYRKQNQFIYNYRYEYST
ncbi:NAD(P)-binding protein [Agaribacter marinus]|uniref:FAD-dependent monooxygenase n=1 Tax=Virgibacillus salarius TaxID=447199 RepID=A0A941I8L9_9BACI|nr:FAD-dependent oxidoreductase [Virgibacillus salarius]MBR7795754.1 FAD-dependent monooxygenase [Virgibacillus salarius]NAZ08467.1 NAD(P)-binding protein [Agaribacter marinus]